MKKSLFPTLGAKVYPSATAGRWNRRIGRTPFQRCQQCGMPNDTRKTGWSKAGEGLSAKGTTPEEWDVTGGCRFCGSMNWADQKMKLPDEDELGPRERPGR